MLNEYEIAFDSMGIYPMSMEGIPRTERQEGWNSALLELSKKALVLIEWKETLTDDKLKLIEKLVESSDIYIRVQKVTRTKNEVKLFINCNDIFGWATIDEEEIKLSELDSLLKAVIENEKWGSVKWVAEKRNESPQDPLLKRMQEDGVYLDF